MAIVSYVNRGPIGVDDCVDLRDLTFYALFDERSAAGELMTRFVAVSGIQCGDGVLFGGPDLARIDKNLRLAPARDGRGRRFDAERAELLSFALQLEDYLQRAHRHPFMPRRRIPALPTLHFVESEIGVTYVNVRGVPKRQIIALGNASDDLYGYSGSTSFDFYHTKFHHAAL